MSNAIMTWFIIINLPLSSSKPKNQLVSPFFAASQSMFTLFLSSVNSMTVINRDQYYTSYDSPCYLIIKQVSYRNPQGCGGWDRWIRWSLGTSRGWSRILPGRHTCPMPGCTPCRKDRKGKRKVGGWSLLSSFPPSRVYSTIVSSDLRIQCPVHWEHNNREW